VTNVKNIIATNRIEISTIAAAGTALLLAEHHVDDPANPFRWHGTGDRSFTGMTEDIASGVYDFPMREYSPSQDAGPGRHGCRGPGTPAELQPLRH